MGIREQLNEHKAIGITAAVIIVLLAVGLSAWQLSGTSTGDLFEGKSFYTVDDGKTWFPDSNDKFPPFQHEGKTAYRAQVFTCDGGKTKWVAYLERCTPQGQKQMAEMTKRLKESKAPPSFASELLENLEVKRPGDKEWVKESDVARASIILQVRCPHNGAHEPEPVFP